MNDSEPPSRVNSKKSGAVKTLENSVSDNNSESKATSVNLKDRFLTGYTPKPQNPEQADLIDTIKILDSKTNELEKESCSGACPFLEPCYEFGMKNNGHRTYIDANCSQEKSYHCDVLPEIISKEKHEKYLAKNSKK